MGESVAVAAGIGGSRNSRGTVMVWRARIVADGGVCSPSMAFCRGLDEGRSAGVSMSISRPKGVGLCSRANGSLSDSRVGVPCLVPARSGDGYERSGGGYERSGDRSGDLTPSRKLLRSRTLVVCSDCMRLWAAPLTNDRSGDLEGIGLVVYEPPGMLSRAFSSNALAAFWMSSDVFGRVVMLGEPGTPGFRGSGGGARSGSELSHLREKPVSGFFMGAAAVGARCCGAENIHWYRRERM